MNKYQVYYKIVYQEWGGSKCLIGKKGLSWSWSCVNDEVAKTKRIDMVSKRSLSLFPPR